MEELQAAVSIPLGPSGPPPFPNIVATGTNDPSFAASARLAQRRAGAPVDCGIVGRLNPAAGHGPWPQAEQFVLASGQEQAREPSSEGSPLVRQE